jgi:hypothetical protein
MSVRNSGEFGLTPANSRAWTPMTPVFSARCRKSRLKGVSTWPATPLAICIDRLPELFVGGRLWAHEDQSARC